MTSTASTTADRLEVVQIQNLIAGQWCDGAGTVGERRNPARPDEVVATVVRATIADVDRAVDAATDAARRWARTPIAERGAILMRAAATLDAGADAIGAELTREEGKTLLEGIAEVRRAAEILRYHAGAAVRDVGELYASPRAGESISVLHRPKGVVGVITPWNFPIAIPAWKIAPALIYGNCVVWKPASQVPLLAYRLAQALEGAGMPAGVLSLVVGDGATGEHLALHAGIDAVTFTGSTGIGRHLIARCGELAKPIQAEMGGKNAAIVLDDAPVEVVAPMVFGAAMASTGQKCTATSRLIVQSGVADELTRELKRLADNWVVGDGLDPSVAMGPAVSHGARDEILEAVSGALASGAKVVAGCEPYAEGALAEGAFVPASVVEVSDGSAPIWQEEVFGPVLAMMVVDTADEAYDLTNQSVFGLSASVFTNDLRQVAEATERLDVGVLHINSETSGAEPHVPFGGVKQSGYGPHEQGRSAREFFTDTVTVYSRPLFGAPH